MIIGGAEDKLRKRTDPQEFVGRQRRRRGADRGHPHRLVARPRGRRGLRRPVPPDWVPPRSSRSARRRATAPTTRTCVELLDDVTGIFMTGGNQLKLSAIICGTPLGDAIVAAHERGAVIAGTSAGASIQSSHMVAFGVGGATPKQRMTQVAAGLGLLQSSVIDQHFDQRNRYGRLLMIVAQSPQLLGHRRRRGHRAAVAARRRRRPGAAGDRPGCGDDLRPGPDRHQRLRGPAVAPLLASGVVLHVLPAGLALRPHHPHPGPARRVDDPTRPPRSPRPVATCARWPATSPPATPPPRAAAPTRAHAARPSPDRRDLTHDRGRPS